ncbi:TPA: hypothetical protein ACH3X3_008283 [Trebouxia sp. C0006]
MRRYPKNIEGVVDIQDGKYIHIQTVVCPQDVCYENINSLSGCRQTHLEEVCVPSRLSKQLYHTLSTLHYYELQTIITLMGNQTHSSALAPLFDDPTKASLCQWPLRAIHMHIHVWCLTCQRRSLGIASLLV